MTNNQEGVQNHSTDKSYIIFSVYKKGKKSLGNLSRHNRLCRDFKKNNSHFKELIGYYKGDKEQSFIIPHSKSSIIDIFVLFNQESVLVLKTHKHGLYKAKLVYKDAREEDLGYFRQVSRNIAEKQDSYTIRDNNYYICTKTDTTIISELKKEGYHD